jgi:pimeloyl-ACP methyl ester carboxylesterase
MVGNQLDPRQITEPSSVFLPADGIALHAMRWAGPARSTSALVVLHGIFEDWRSFAVLAGELAAHRTVYSVDLRGHGHSARPSRGYRFADYAQDILALLTTLGAEHDEVDLLGHSLGANVALFVASAGHPRLGRVVAVEPPILLAEDWPPVRAQIRKDWQHAQLPLDQLVAELAAARDREPGWLRMIAEALTSTANGVFAAMVHSAQGTVDWADVLGRITVPVLAVAADPAVPGALLHGARLAELRRGLAHVRICLAPGAAHHVELDQPDLLREAVEEFLRADRP